MSLLHSCMFSTHVINIYHISVKSIVYQRRSHDRISINENAKQECSKGFFEVAFHSNVISSSKKLKNKKPGTSRLSRWFSGSIEHGIVASSSIRTSKIFICIGALPPTYPLPPPTFQLFLFPSFFSCVLLFFFVGPFLFRAKRTQLVYGRHTSR